MREPLVAVTLIVYVPKGVAGGAPVPAKFTTWGLPAALSATLNVAEREPVAAGAKVTPIEHFPPANTLDPQLLV